MAPVSNLFTLLYFPRELTFVLRFPLRRSRKTLFMFLAFSMYSCPPPPILLTDLAIHCAHELLLPTTYYYARIRWHIYTIPLERPTSVNLNYDFPKQRNKSKLGVPHSHTDRVTGILRHPQSGPQRTFMCIHMCVVCVCVCHDHGVLKTAHRTVSSLAQQTTTLEAGILYLLPFWCVWTWWERALTALN